MARIVADGMSLPEDITPEKFDRLVWGANLMYDRGWRPPKPKVVSLASARAKTSSRRQQARNESVPPSSKTTPEGTD